MEKNHVDNVFVRLVSALNVFVHINQMLLLVLCIGVCQTQGSMSPNTAVLAGSSATFMCQIDSEKVCFIYRANITDSDYVDVCRKGYDDKFSKRCKEGTYTLAINDVRLSDAGFYTCTDCYDTGPGNASAHLVVLGKN